MGKPIGKRKSNLPKNPETGKAKRGPGRPKGSKDSIQSLLRQELCKSMTRIDIGKWLDDRSVDRPDLYAQLMIKYVPAPAPEINANGESEVTPKVNLKVIFVSPSHGE